jgi:Na+-driven multidrug efflux pump
MSRNRGQEARSRKWLLVLIIIGISTIGTFLPPIISAWVFGEPKPLVILSGTEWVSVISLVVGAYITGNVFQKHVEAKETAAALVVSKASAKSMAAIAKTQSTMTEKEGED